MFITDYEKGIANAYHTLARSPWKDQIVSALTEGSGCAPAGDSGRGTLMRFPCGDGFGIVRKYLRGGAIRHILRESYLLDNRPLRELRLHDYAWRKGLPVPEPLGACWQWRGPFVRGALATREIPAPNLLDYLKSNPANAVDVMRQAGEVVRLMHDFGIWHADLQVRNLLVTEQGVFVLDFDNGRVLFQVSKVQRARNLFRLRRSLEKNGLPLALFRPICEGYGVELLPAWMSRIYDAKGKVSDFVAGSNDGH